MMNGSILVDLEPVGRRVSMDAGLSLLEAARKAGVDLIALCNGTGTCGKCRVRLMEGDLRPATAVEARVFSPAELAGGWWLACQAVPRGNVRIHVPPDSLSTPQRLQIEGRQGPGVSPVPALTTLDVRLAPPCLEDTRSDARRLNDELGRLRKRASRISPGVLRSLSERLRALDWTAQLVIRNGELIAVLPPEGPVLGVSFDLGTTKLAGYLLDLRTGHTLAETGAMNPQIAYGEDVVSRISHANERPDGREELQKSVAGTLNSMLAALCEEAGVSNDQIVEIVAVGNTAMHHLFAGLPVRQLGASPYVPAASDPLDLPAGEIGLNASPGAVVHLPANIAGFVGADHVAMILATGLQRTKETVVAVDIGTNTEITLAVGNGDLYACSCASGPAFEGAHIGNGMRAAPGAIEHVRLENGRTLYQTIGNRPPVGICGSGILDAVSEMVAAGIVDRRGQFRDDAPGLRTDSGLRRLVLVPSSSSGHGQDIVVSRRDINEIQLAKGAIRAGIEILLQEAGRTHDDIRRFIVAGAFGTYLDTGSAVRIGMFPKLASGRFRQVGNAAGVGAKRILINKNSRARAAAIARKVNYIELTNHPRYTKTFLESMYF